MFVYAFNAKLPSSRFCELNSVVFAIRSISLTSWSISVCIIVLSESAFVPFADWIASSFMRCRMSWISAMAPSAVFRADRPSLALWFASCRLLIWAFIRLAMASPAALSAALLILYPLDSFLVDAATLLSLLFIAFLAIMDETL